MTTDKGFKRVVRARMAKTGERYAAARRALMDGAEGEVARADGGPEAGYRLRGGRYPDTATLASVLADRGVRSPLDGEPLSEAMILGIGGGLGAGYILWEFQARNGAVLTLGFSNRWQYPGIPGWFGTTFDRLGLQADLFETGGAKGARDALDGLLAARRPAIAWVDRQAMGTWGQPEAMSGIMGYPVVVHGRTDDDRYLVDDRSRRSLVFDASTMAAARGRIGSYKHRLIAVREPAATLDAGRLRAAIVDGLGDQVDHLRSRSDSFSLPAWRKWARMTTDRKAAKGWPRVFPDGQGLFGTLLDLVELADGAIGATGGHLRDLYADFLVEAAAALDRPALEAVSASWREIGDLWEDLADAALPPDLDGAIEVIDDAEALHEAVRAGEPGRERASAAARAVWAARADYGERFPGDADRVTALLADLGQRIGEIHLAEVEAIERLGRAIDR